MQVTFSPRVEARDHMQLVDNGTCLSNELAETALKPIATISLIPIILLLYAVNWSESRWNGRDTMDVIFFHITSVRINTWNGVNQLKEQFFLNLIILL